MGSGLSTHPGPRVTVQDIQQMTKHTVETELFSSARDELSTTAITHALAGKANVLVVFLVDDEVFGLFASRAIDVKRLNLFELAQDKTLVTFHASRESNGRLVASQDISVGVSPRHRTFVLRFGAVALRFTVDDGVVQHRVRVEGSAVRVTEAVRIRIYQCR